MGAGERVGRGGVEGVCLIDGCAGRVLRVMKNIRWLSYLSRIEACVYRSLVGLIWLW